MGISNPNLEPIREGFLEEEAPMQRPGGQEAIKQEKGEGEQSGPQAAGPAPWCAAGDRRC